MTETVIAALISAISAVIINIIALIQTSNKTHNMIDKQMAILDVKITQLSDRVEKHNNVIERTYKLEEQNAVQDAELKSINDRIGKIERT